MGISMGTQAAGMAVFIDPYLLHCSRLALRRNVSPSRVYLMWSDLQRLT